jgi:pimeloyl-ACP methyl ester carboxylesterase
LWDEVLRTDLAERVGRLEIPVYFFLGRYDYTTSYDLARDYFLKLDASVKGFYTFEQSAHSPLFEEPERAREILRRDVLEKQTILSDPMPG